MGREISACLHPPDGVFQPPSTLVEKNVDSHQDVQEKHEKRDFDKSLTHASKEASKAEEPNDEYVHIYLPFFGSYSPKAALKQFNPASRALQSSRLEPAQDRRSRPPLQHDLL